MEGGFEVKRGPVAFRANLYAMEFRDEIALTGEQSPIGYDLRRNVDSSYRRGLEIEGSWQVVPALRLRASANWSRNRIRSWTQFYDSYGADGSYVGKESRTYADVKPLLTPELTANLGADWTVAKGLTLGALCRYVDTSFLDNTNQAGFTTPAGFRLDASVVIDLSSLVPAGRPRLRISGENLTDNGRLWPSGYAYFWLERGVSGQTLSGIPSYFPQATRSGTVTLDFGF